MAYTDPQGSMYGQPQLLGDIFDDINKIAGKVGGITDQIKQIASEAGSVASGKKKVATIPTDGSYVTIPVPGQPYGMSLPLMPILFGGGALLAVYLLSRRR